MENTIQAHKLDYKDLAYLDYSFQELGAFVHLLAKRATHRSNPAKMAKDLEDARNYLAMMNVKLTALKAQLLPDTSESVNDAKD
jgi:hypothetical protein